MYGDWYARNMYREGTDQYLHHWRVYGHPSVHGWKDMVQLWKAAAKKHGLRFGVSEHLGATFAWWSHNKNHDRHGPYAGVPYDGNDPAYEGFYLPNQGELIGGLPAERPVQCAHCQDHDGIGRENRMEYTTLGRSNLIVSKICLGTMHFGSKTPEADAFQIMDRALDMGIQFFDTANVYGGRPHNMGRTEEIMGRWFAQGGGRRDRVVLASKVYGNMVADPGPNEDRGLSAYRVRAHLADSLRRQQTDHLDLYQVHHFDRHISLQEFWRTFERIENDGDVLYIGTSNFPGWGLTKFQMHAWQQGLVGLVSEQTQYNLLNRIPELEVLPAALDMGIGVLAYMPLGGGLLTGKKPAVEGSRTQSVAREYNMTAAHYEQLDQFSALCREIGETEVAVAIAWTLAQPAVASAIVGVRTLAHLDHLERAAELQLDGETLARLTEIFDINRGRPLQNAPAPEAYAW